MSAAIHLQTHVLPGRKIEITSQDLPETGQVDLVIYVAGAKEREQLSNRFSNLANRWKRETAIHSSASQIAMHPAYQEIIGMGWPVVGLILNDLKESNSHWFWALRAITGDDPIKPEQRGKIAQMSSAWLSWGVDHGYA
jgi:hypothetical protein